MLSGHIVEKLDRGCWVSMGLFFVFDSDCTLGAVAFDSDVKEIALQHFGDGDQTGLTVVMILLTIEVICCGDNRIEKRE